MIPKELWLLNSFIAFVACIMSALSGDWWQVAFFMAIMLTNVGIIDGIEKRDRTNG